MQRKFFLLTFLLFAALTYTSAQTTASNTSDISSSLAVWEMGEEDWTFYLDQEKKVYYIDFESINVNLSDIKVINEQGEVVLNDKLWDLPVNTIYELDMRNLKPGKYRIELRTYTSVIQKDLSVSE